MMAVKHMKHGGVAFKLRQLMAAVAALETTPAES